jgi:hypothetical protein
MLAVFRRQLHPSALKVRRRIERETPTGEALADASQAISLPFHPEVQQLAEHGGAVVR